jgi:hypothetical protein
MRSAVLALLLILTFCFAPSLAYAAEKQIGLNCGSDNSAIDWDTIAQCSTNSGGGTLQHGPLILGAMTNPPYAATTCTSSYYGMVQWTGSALEVCDSVGWVTLAGANTPVAFSFTNQTGVSMSATISSNAVTLSGFTGTIPATCGSGCTNIARNGTWCTCTTLAGFQSGDTIAIQQTSSSSTSSTTNATVTAGSTVSGTWSVTTNSNTANAFSFTVSAVLRSPFPARGWRR